MNSLRQSVIFFCPKICFTYVNETYFFQYMFKSYVCIPIYYSIHELDCIWSKVYFISNQNTLSKSFHIPSRCSLVTSWWNMKRLAYSVLVTYKIYFLIIYNQIYKFMYAGVNRKVYMWLEHIYRLITGYLLLRVNLDKIMHPRWDFDASCARTRRVSALDKHQNWSASALFCLNSRAQSKYAVVNLIHTRRKQTFLSFIMW